MINTGKYINKEKTNDLTSDTSIQPIRAAYHAQVKVKENSSPEKDS